LNKAIMLLIILWSVVESFPIESSYKKAHQKALEKDKIMVVFITKKGCIICM